MDTPATKFFLQICNKAQTLKNTVIVTSLASLLTKGSEKFGVNMVSAVMSETGFVIDDDEVLPFLSTTSVLMLLQEHEEWEPEYSSPLTVPPSEVKEISRKTEEPSKVAELPVFLNENEVSSISLSNFETSSGDIFIKNSDGTYGIGVPAMADVTTMSLNLLVPVKKIEIEPNNIKDYSYYHMKDKIKNLPLPDFGDKLCHVLKVSESGTVRSSTHASVVQQTIEYYLRHIPNLKGYGGLYSLISQKMIKEYPSLGTGGAHDENWMFGTMLCAAVQLNLGVSAAYTGVTLPSMMNATTSEDLTLSNSEASLFSAIVNIGAVFGSLSSCLIMMYLGQRSTLFLFLPIGMISWILLGFAKTFWMLLVARLLQGLCFGVTSPCAANYVVETVHKSIRGRLFGIIMLALQIGILFVYLVGSSNLSWRNIGFVCGLIPVTIPFVGFFFLPHSPRWLATQNRMAESERALIFFRGTLHEVATEMNEIILQTSKMDRHISVKGQISLLLEKSVLRRFLVLAILSFASNCTGNWVLVYYAVSVFESSSVSIDPYLSSIFIALTRTIGVGIYLILGDKLGRRPLFIAPIFLTGVSMVLLGIFFYLKQLGIDVSFVFWLPLFSLASFHMFTCVANPVLLLLRSELLPNSSRAVGVGLLFALFYGGSFFAAFAYPFMKDSVGLHWTFWIYGSISFLMVIVAVIYIPETKGKTLEEINLLFDKKAEVVS